MKKKGFTLIELLAVIVILAIVALIATPTILGVIQKSKKASSEASAYGYIDAVEKYIMTNSMNMSKPNINNGTYKDNELDVEYKGKGPDNALITVEKGIVKEAKLCINKYSFDYDGKEVTSSVNNYCSNNYKIKLVIDNNIEEKSIEKELSTTFELSDITNKTNIVCNNGALPTIENNILTISNIFGDTTCKINSTLEDTINNIDDTENNIIMISDEIVSRQMIIKSDKNVKLNLGEYYINNIVDSTVNSVGIATATLKNNGKLSISATTGGIKGLSDAIEGVEGILNITGGNYNKIFVRHGESNLSNFSTSCTKDLSNCYSLIFCGSVVANITNYDTTVYGKALGICNSSAKVYLSDSKIKCTNDNCIWVNGNNKSLLNTNNIEVNSYGYSIRNDNNGTININNSNLMNSGVTNTVINDSESEGIISINNSIIKNVIYENATKTTKSVVYIDNSGLINIKNSILYSENGPILGTSNVTTDDALITVENSEMTSINDHGVYFYGKGSLYINDSTINTVNSGIANIVSGTIYLNNTEINVSSPGGSQGAIANRGTGTIYICGGRINGLSNLYDLYNASTGIINYSSDTILKNNKIYNPNGTVKDNYTGTCIFN